MKSLLTDINAIEQEAATIIETAQEKGEDALRKLLGEESRIIDMVRTDAEKKGEAIINEQVSRAKNDANTTHQDQATALKAISDAASTNHDAAVEFVINHLIEQD